MQLKLSLLVFDNTNITALRKSDSSDSLNLATTVIAFVDIPVNINILPSNN